MFQHSYFIPLVMVTALAASLSSLCLGSPVGGKTPSSGEQALAATARGGQYLFILFWKDDDAATRTAHQVLAREMGKRIGKAAAVGVRVNDPAEKSVVDQYGVSRSPMPLVLAVAPNGAVTRAVPLKVTEQEIAAAFVSPAMALCLKAIQDRRLVLVCVHPAGKAPTVPDGVREFKADPRFGPATEIVTMRADDAAEKDFLTGLQIDGRTTVPVTVLLAPPGRLLGSFPGAVTRQQLTDRITAPQGCCPGGKCGPNGCCAPK